ncbi:uncharacterized protein LOC143688679 [Tamandua tetradactyla]|uniref:uncharacterized protein LOC143688679 n=1 Tax=Tamandua tetradactyla TaxID=48850 RepID=UPI0040547D79
MDRSQSGSPEGTSVRPRRPSRRHRRRMRALKKKLEKMHLKQPSGKEDPQMSQPPSKPPKRSRRTVRSLVFKLTQAALDEDDPQNPRTQKRQLLNLYDEARERCDNPPQLKANSLNNAHASLHSSHSIGQRGVGCCSAPPRSSFCHPG